MSGPANFKKRWQYQLGRAADYEDNPLRRFQGLTFKILEIKIAVILLFCLLNSYFQNPDYLNKALLSLRAFDIHFLAKVVDREAYPARL